VAAFRAPALLLALRDSSTSLATGIRRPYHDSPAPNESVVKRTNRSRGVFNRRNLSIGMRQSVIEFSE